MSAETDTHHRELLQRIAQASEAALAEFYNAFENPVYEFVLRRLDDPFAAAEILNEVMMEVWRTAHRFRGEARVTTWVLGIANNKVMDEFRRRKRSRLRYGSEACERRDCTDTDDQDLMRHLVTKEQADMLEYCLERLSVQHRTVVWLAFFVDMSYREISRVTGCPGGTVKTRMLHAKKALKRCVQRFISNHGEV